MPALPELLADLEPALGSRALFPDLAPRVYLSHAAISPPSVAVARAAAEVVSSYAAVGMGAFTIWIEQRARLRALLGGLIGARSEDIALIPNTTQGVIDVALCFPWRAGDRILCFEGEFPTNVTPWQRASVEFGLELEMLPLDGFGDGSGDGLARLKESLGRGGVRLVAVSAVQFQTGLAMPLREMSALCREAGAELFVDAIQAVGILPLADIAPHIDYLTAGSHKWLGGLEGCGFLYVHPARAADLVPRVAGWMSHEEAFSFLFAGSGHLRYDRPIRGRADFLETGAPNTLGFAALEASASLLVKLGVPDIFAHVQRWHDAVEPPLQALGFSSLRPSDRDRRSGILSLSPPPGVSIGELTRGLAGLGVACTGPDGLLRLAPHWPNAREEVAVVISAVDQVLAGDAPNAPAR